MWCSVQDVADSNIGLTYSPSDLSEKGIPVLRSNNIQKSHLFFKNVVKVSCQISNKQYLNNGDLLICARNGSRALVGKCALVEGLTEPTSFGAFMAVCRSICNPWISLVLRSQYFNEYLDNSNSTAINQVTQKMFLTFQIPLPPLNEQNRLYGYIDDLFKTIERIDELKDSVHELAKSVQERILDLAIHGKLVPQDPSDEPAIELFKRINPGFEPAHNLHYKGNLPKGWCFSTIGDLFQHNTGKALNGRERNGDGLRYITTSNLYWDRFDLTEVRTMPFTEVEKEKCRATKGDLLVCEGGDIGRAAIWPYDYDVMIQNHIHRLRPKTNLSVRFFYYIFLLYKQQGLIGGKGIAILGLSSRELDRMVVPVPPVEEQHRIVAGIKTLFTVLEEIQTGLEA